MNVNLIKMSPGMSCQGWMIVNWKYGYNEYVFVAFKKNILMQ